MITRAQLTLDDVDSNDHSDLITGITQLFDYAAPRVRAQLTVTPDTGRPRPIDPDTASTVEPLGYTAGYTVGYDAGHAAGVALGRALAAAEIPGPPPDPATETPETPGALVALAVAFDDCRHGMHTWDTETAVCTVCGTVARPVIPEVMTAPAAEDHRPVSAWFSESAQRAQRAPMTSDRTPPPPIAPDTETTPLLHDVLRDDRYRPEGDRPRADTLNAPASAFDHLSTDRATELLGFPAGPEHKAWHTDDEGCAWRYTHPASAAPSELPGWHRYSYPARWAAPGTEPMRARAELDTPEGGGM